MLEPYRALSGGALMARAVFQKGQRVFVRPVGVWAEVQRIVPQWVRGIEEPLKVLYDVGLGRDFSAAELDADIRPTADEETTESWRLVRLANRWHSEADGVRRNHPYPGTYPVIMTDEVDWGGWRVPAAEYERSPDRIEHQARIIVNALRMLRLTRRISDAAVSGEPLEALAAEADSILRDVYDAAPESMAPAEESSALIG